MKAAYLAENELIKMNNEYPTPVADGKKAIMKIHYCGICGSDVHNWDMGEKMIKGLVLGHEFAGTIADPGDRKDLKVGDRVTCIATSPCGECDFCKSGQENLCPHNALSPGTFRVDVPGAYAEYFVPYKNDFIRKLPDNVSLEEAAMIEPTVTGYRALKLAGLKKGETVLVAGGGIIGTMCAQWAKQMGASYVALTEVNKKRADMVRSLGFVDDVFDPTGDGVAQEMLKKTGNGFDIFVDCAGVSASINFGISQIKRMGRVSLVGINWGMVPISVIGIQLKQAILYGVLTCTPRDFDACLNAVADGSFPVKHYHTSSINFDENEINAAMRKLKDPTNSEFKILMKVSD